MTVFVINVGMEKHGGHSLGFGYLDTTWHQSYGRVRMRGTDLDWSLENIWRSEVWTLVHFTRPLHSHIVFINKYQTSKTKNWIVYKAKREAFNFAIPSNLVLKCLLFCAINLLSTDHESFSVDQRLVFLVFRRGNHGYWASDGSQSLLVDAEINSYGN